MRISKFLTMAGAAIVAGGISTAAIADITILAWPGGPAETALRKVVDKYNETSENQAELLYFSRDNFFDKMLADAAAGSKEFDVMLTATYNVGKYAPFMVPINDLVTDDVMKVFPQSAIELAGLRGQGLRHPDRPQPSLPLLPDRPHRRTPVQRRLEGEVRRDLRGVLRHQDGAQEAG